MKTVGTFFDKAKYYFEKKLMGNNCIRLVGEALKQNGPLYGYKRWQKRHKRFYAMFNLKYMPVLCRPEGLECPREVELCNTFI